MGGTSNPTRRAWLTPDDTPGTLACHRVYVPSGAAYEAAFRGALLLLADAVNWEQTGTQTPQDVADAFFEGFMQTVDGWEDDCGT